MARLSQAYSNVCKYEHTRQIVAQVPTLQRSARMPMTARTAPVQLRKQALKNNADLVAGDVADVRRLVTKRLAAACVLVGLVLGLLSLRAKANTDTAGHEKAAVTRATRSNSRYTTKSFQCVCVEKTIGPGSCVHGTAYAHTAQRRTFPETVSLTLRPAWLILSPVQAKIIVSASLNLGTRKRDDTLHQRGCVDPYLRRWRHPWPGRRSSCQTWCEWMCK